ncbi:MAG TPA: ACP S-malonyltransferase [Candidatus Omnitrophota bacterium]|nr:ACP S-malonyltransferase [Candidatus Omnitrophota bacterium]
MKNIAYIFPGQGSQYVGMGKEIYRISPQAKSVFDKADKVLGFSLTKLCFQGPQEQLKSTINCQPAIFTLSVAVLEAFKSHPKSKNFKPKFTAGLSLGEYSALVASEVFSFEDALKIVRQRAEYMEEDARSTPGKMAAILGMDLEKVKAICKDCATYVANLNCPGQVVVSGKAVDIDKTVEAVKAQGFKAIVLEVSGAFHSYYMNPAGEKLSALLNKSKINPAQIPVVSNVIAKPEIKPEEIKANLVRQVSASVLWEESVRYMAGQGVTEFIEIGPGQILKGMLRRIDSKLKVFNLEKPQDIENLAV